jgi:TonB family protein
MRPSSSQTTKPPASSKSKEESLIDHKASPRSRPRRTPQATTKVTPRAKKTVKNSLSKQESSLHNSREVTAFDKTESKSLRSTTDNNSLAKAAFLKAKKEGSNSSSTANSTGNGVDIDHDALNAYHELIHDRFYSQWEQPTSIPTEHKHDFICTLQLTIQADGTISHFQLAKTSGNPLMDSSVLSAAEKVLTIAPLPSAIATGGSYKVNINFELE